MVVVTLFAVKQLLSVLLRAAVAGFLRDDGTAVCKREKPQYGCLQKHQLTTILFFLGTRQDCTVVNGCKRIYTASIRKPLTCQLSFVIASGFRGGKIDIN